MYLLTPASIRHDGWCSVLESQAGVCFLLKAYTERTVEIVVDILKGKLTLSAHKGVS